MELSLRRIKETPSLWQGRGFFSDMERNMGGLFDEVFGGSLVDYVTPETRGMFSPRTDIKETTKNIKVTAEMPGISQEDIDVSVHNGILTISGEKKVENEETETDYHHVERSYGCFSRSISLPDTVETDKVEALFKNGVLTVTLPKNKKTVHHAKKIPVTTA
jgi:HSP20 family protein